MSADLNELAVKLLARHAALKADRAVWDSYWQEIANYVMPRKSNITNTVDTPSSAKQQVLFDSTAIQSNNTLANGQMSGITPLGMQWSSFEPPRELAGSDAATQWFKACTEIAHLELARSNFYSEIHELYLDRGGFGTSAMFCEKGIKNPLRFETWEVGSFSIAEDSEGYVDTVSREYEFSVRQAAQHFGAENLSEAMQKTLAEKDPTKIDAKHTFIHVIYPREASEIDTTKADPENMPIASVYIDETAKKVVRNSGFTELPFFVTRFLKAGKTPYGWSPSWIALPEERQLSFLEMNMDVLAEVAAFPRMLIPDNLKGDVDMRAGGHTFFDPANPNATPKEWATAGRYDIGEARAEQKRKAIERAFFVDVFQMFSNIEKQMTATEVTERSSEKINQMLSMFARMVTELFNPLMKRVFMILLRDGYFPPPPPEIIMQGVDGAFLPEPKINYSGRLTMSIRLAENVAANQTIAAAMPIAELRPEVLDNFDFDRILRESAMTNGMPSGWIVPADVVAQIRQERSKAQAQQAQLEQAQMAADAAGKAARVTPDSMIGQALS